MENGIKFLSKVDKNEQIKQIDQMDSKTELELDSSDRFIKKHDKNIIVAGYFDRHNLGDDLFRDVWEHIFSKPGFESCNVSYIGLDNLRVCTELKDCDTLIFAGGDVLNYYFLSELKNIVHKFQFTGKLFAFSVGIPYQVVIVDGLLDQFHFLMCRAKGDAFNLRRRFGSNHVRYFPDLSVYLPELFQVEKSKKEFIGLNEHKTFNDRLNVGVFLTRNIYEKNPCYDRVVENIAKSLDNIVEMNAQGTRGFELFLIPFNTNEKNVFEDDILINSDVHNKVRNKQYIHNVTRQLSVEEMWWTFKNQLDMNITMRYHSHMYSIVSRVPFVSLYTTRKVQNLLLDTQLSNYSYAFPLNEDDLPTDFSTIKFCEKFENAFNDRFIITKAIKSYLDTYSSLEQFDNTLKTLVDMPLEKVQIAQRVYPLTTINNVIESLVKFIWSDKGNIYTEKDVIMVADEIYKNKLNFSTLLGELSREKKEKMGDFLSALACFGLIRIPYPKYHYGMAKKILNVDFHAKNEFMWVWGDYQKDNEKFFIENPMMRRNYFNATFVGIEDFKGCHRSGWQYILNHLMSFHSDTSPLIFDNYIDRTFHWAHDVYKYTHLIPFKRPWCGFIHHTFDESYSPFNVPNLFRNDTFLQSLKHCHALFTLSQDLAIKINVLLQQYGYKHVLVKSFTHPTECSKLIFSIDKFMDNNHRKVVQIGAWLRDNYAIYKLVPYGRKRSPQKRIPIKKAVLRGKHMNNYFKPDNLKLSIEKISESETDDIEYDFNRGDLLVTTNNKFALGVIRSIHDEWNSVEILDTLDNDQYDQLLAENIVFLKLIDASAVNTVIECVVRCTPVLVNRHAAVEEMLGAEYPFYYDDMTEAGVKVNDIDLIKKTNRYLIALNKKKFTMEYFLQDFDNWFKENPLQENMVV